MQEDKYLLQTSGNIFNEGGGCPRELCDFIFRFSRGGGESVFNQNNSLPTKILAWEANLMKTTLRQPKSRGGGQSWMGQSCLIF